MPGSVAARRMRHEVHDPPAQATLAGESDERLAWRAVHIAARAPASPRADRGLSSARPADTRVPIPNAFAARPTTDLERRRPERADNGQTNGAVTPIRGRRRKCKALQMLGSGGRTRTSDTRIMIPLL